LKDLRAAAARLWRSKPATEIRISPGTYEEAFVISGSRMAPFSRLQPRESYISGAVDAALKADR
jgi:hypothetical protein